MSVITEFHGWITIRCFYESSDAFDEREKREKPLLVAAIKGYLAQYQFYHTAIHFDTGYDEAFLSVCGFSWHYDECQAVIGLYRFIAEQSSGSYGILSVHREDENSFLTYVLKHGSLQAYTDPYLSPCIPEIEDFPK